MSRTFVLPEKYMKRVLAELSCLPHVQGKVSLTVEINCGTGGTVSSMKVKRFSEDEER